MKAELIIEQQGSKLCLMNGNIGDSRIVTNVGFLHWELSSGVKRNVSVVAENVSCTRTKTFHLCN